jgi:hypothetical protein
MLPDGPAKNDIHMFENDVIKIQFLIDLRKSLDLGVYHQTVCRCMSKIISLVLRKTKFTNGLEFF